MSINYYFQNGIPESYSANQRLVEDMIVESISITGMETYYLPRTLQHVDTILTEDSLSTFDNAFPLEMYLDNVQGFEGDGTMLSKFGIEINDSCTFVVARRRWEAEVGRSGIATLSRPVEGDIVYLPLTKSYFEIKKVTATNPFYQLGKLFVFKLECELFQFNQERVNTGIAEIDEIAQLFDLTEQSHFVFTESGDNIMSEDGYSIIADYNDEDIDHSAQNEEFQKSNGVLDFSEHNPFAEIQH
jgi:hypothetical protein